MQLATKYVDTDFQNYSDFSKRCAIRVPDRFNFGYDIVDEYARLDPDKLALLWCNDGDDVRRFTFGDIKRESDKIANLLTGLGIGRGDAVMLVLKRRYQYWTTAVALCKIGAIMIPASYLLTEKDVEYRVNAADVKLILCVDEPDIVAAVEGAKPRCPSLAHIALVDGAEREGWINFDKQAAAQSESFAKPALPNENTDTMIIYFTSGTTGMPKMVALNYIYPLGHIIGAKFWHNTTEDDLHVTVADTGWAKCSWGKIYGQWIAGTAQFVYDMEKFVPELLSEKIAKHRVTSFCAPPTIYRFLIKADLSKYDLSALRHASTAGEPLNPEVYKQFLRLTGVKIREAFGQSESTPIFANFYFDEPMPGSLGKPNPLYKIALLNEAGDVCEFGEEGEVCIRVGEGKPVGLFDGYYRDKERTDAVWYNGWYHTGDIAWQDEEGYYWFVGRADDVIKSSGYRIGPFEVESALMTHPSVLECAISAAPDEVRGQVVKATVVLAKGYTASDALKKELQEHVKHVTAPYKYPRIVEFVSELPKTMSGKIRRVQLRQEAQAKAEAFRKAMSED